MQTEDTEETATSTEETMTFTKGTTLITEENFPISPINDADLCKIPNFDNINLEDDIEKVEVDSGESPSSPSSSSSSMSLNLVDQIDKPEFLTLQNFVGIPEENPNESVKNWLQKITEVTTTASSVSSATVAAAAAHSKKTSSNVQQIATTRVVKYQDLPYMGEITLDNSKPRRGRKPKKADICHLIYKNYGTIFPGTPNASSYLEKESPASRKHSITPTIAVTASGNTGEKETADSNRSDVQNKIISSLLEKRLTQENKKPAINGLKSNTNEPLNLCIRDMNHLKIRLLNKNEKSCEIKSEPQSDDDIEIITETPSPMTVKSELRYPAATPESISASSSDTPNTPDGPNGTAGYVYWPNTGVFIHPLALQQQLMMYQRLAGNMNCSLPSSHSPRPPASDSIKAEPADVPLRRIVPKIHKVHDLTSDTSGHEAKPKRNAHSNSNEKTPTKRKRSAIFIPPIPTENSTNPATEVSICKFKFTGGAKPSLQEKKMLSVDSGGNFRYYSGTGDKSMRGYEFFPRETLQQQISNTQGSSTGAFLQASGEKIYPIPPLDITGGNNTSDFLLTPQLPGSSLATIQHHQDVVGNSNHHHVRNKKRKSRKSIQREKLEQTFKEKGFLIQTQKLESAEGATYCKFRQLRKFTRYLFRSWKDYLPGNVREMQENEQREQMQLVNINNSNDMPPDSNSSIVDGLSIISGDIASTS